MEMIYLDYAAATPCDPDVVQKMLPFFSAHYGNAGSHHALGTFALEAVEKARKQVAMLLKADVREIIFTSGATESINLALRGTARQFLSSQGKCRLVSFSTEHKAVLETLEALKKEGVEIEILPVDEQGKLDKEQLRAALKTPTTLVSVMAANNETGVLADLEEISQIVRGQGALLHVDLAQIAGKLPLDAALFDLASISAHKLYGPKGCGALYVRRRPRVRLRPIVTGGGQERLLRSGTLPVPLLVGFGEACEKAQKIMAEEGKKVSELRKLLEEGLRALFPEGQINGGKVARLPGTLNFCFPKPYEAEKIMKALPGLAMSKGSACTAGSGAGSYVLRAMGLEEARTQRSLRLSLGRFTSQEEIQKVLEKFSELSCQF
ncbi:cysteine desulfurase [Acetobacteraceae bacterium]|nr:cysteine desulfurase [Acetobacteraceae bacterium]